MPRIRPRTLPILSRESARRPSKDMATSASFFAALGATALIASTSSAFAAPTPTPTPTPEESPAPSATPLPYRRCVEIAPSNDPTARRLRDELRLAGEAIREPEAGAPSTAPSSLPCDRWITVSEDAIAVFDTRMFSPRLLERVKGPIADASVLRIVEVAHTRDAATVAPAIPTSSTPPSATAAAPSAPEEPRSRHLVVALNPLALTFMRLSLDAEWAIEPSFALRASGHAQLMPNSGLYDTSFVGGGGELGFRYYSGRRGSEGLFVGPSLVGGFYTANWSPANVDVSYRVLGPALDVGYSTLVTDHLWISAGAGVQHLFSSDRTPALGPTAGALATAVEEPRVLRLASGAGFQPRLTVSIGWSFD